MENQFKVDGYTFKEIKSTNPHRPYRVRCIETGDEKDGAISYEEAARLLIGQYEFAKNIWDNNCKDEKYVNKIFSNALLGRKKSECDEVVKTEIIEQGKIKGTVLSITSEDKFAEYKEYQTEHFVIKVLFENGLIRKSTRVVVEKKNIN
jgi:nucleoside-triphosphatase THEP1